MTVLVPFSSMGSAASPREHVITNLEYNGHEQQEDEREPYNPRDLSIFGYASGATLWHYRTKNTAATVLTPGYFDPSGDMLRAGDFIMATTLDGGGMLHVEKVENRTVTAVAMAGAFIAVPKAA